MVTGHLIVQTVVQMPTATNVTNQRANVMNARLDMS